MKYILLFNKMTNVLARLAERLNTLDDENEVDFLWRVVFKRRQQQRFGYWTTATPDDEAPPAAQHNVSLSAFLAPLYRA
jgi:hypothetical protein